MPPKPPKLNGSRLLQELAETSLVPEPAAPPASPVAATSPRRSAPSSRGGRPAKAGADNIPLTLRVSPELVDQLTDAATRLPRQTGRPVPTPQDVIRLAIDAALKDPAFPLNLIPKDAP